MDRPRLPGDAVLLAGGEARRLGRRKETIRLGGRTLLERHLDRWTPCFERVHVSVRAGRTEGVPAGVATIEDPPDLASVIDLLPRLIETIGGPFWLVAIDLPVVPVEVPHTLFAAHRPGVCVFPEHERGVEPLCAVYDPAALPAIEALRADGRRALHRIAETADSVRLSYPDDFPPLVGLALRLGPFFNVNTPEDLAALEAAFAAEDPA